MESNMEVQTQKKMGFQNGDDLDVDFTSQRMEACKKISGYWVEEMVPEEEVKMKENGVLEDFVRGNYNINNMAPVDEVCPICFDKFNIPCRTNCGHWFCAGCVMQFWMYRSSIQQCKCPLCCCIINNLAPEMSQDGLPTDDVVEVLKKVRRYNGLSTGGMQGLFQKVLALPLLMNRIIRILIAPDGVRCIYYVMRLLGLLLAFLYEMGEYEFIATGGYGIQRAFHVGASVLSGSLLFIGIAYRCVLRCRARRLAVVQDWHM
ncbi:uncharacterized protein LOC142538934 [Primulina tabacum]|uniref:uncharacterized protein LOC142538934 n=1 Tax=Primulina tabacum TaxID=48773 RepID=UPI003F5A2668